MRAFRLTRSKMPLSTASVLELFQKIDAKYPFIAYEPIPELVPSAGELFIIEGLDTPILDGQVYAGSSEVFHEESFDVVIDRAKAPLKLFRFLYFNRAHHYRVAHYLICEKKTQGSIQAKASTNITDTICNNFLNEYSLLRNILFKPAPERPADLLDHIFWKDLMARHISDIANNK